MAAPALHLTDAQLETFASRLPPIRLTKYIPHTPTHRQLAGLVLNDTREVLYGGAAGGGKSDWLLMAALQYVDIPGYAALLLRRTYAQLSKADSLMTRCQEWLASTDAKWDGKATRWLFPSGAVLEFGHVQYEKDKFNYQGPAYQFIGFDELTQFTETQYRYLFSRLRRLEHSNIPLRVRAGSNPGGEGHEWVKRRLIPVARGGMMAPRRDRVFIPAKLEDNPHLDRAEYLRSLANLDPLTREQLLNGDWTARASGGFFKREWFEIVETAPAGARKVRAWDLAATEPTPETDPDYLAGCLMSEYEGRFFIEDMKRTRTTPAGVEALLMQTADLDGVAVDVWIEQEPGSSGKIAVDNYIRKMSRYAVRGQPSTGDKVVRARPLSAQAEAGNVKLVAGPWVGAFLDEVEVFHSPACVHDDQVDAGSLAHSKLTGACLQVFA